MNEETVDPTSELEKLRAENQALRSALSQARAAGLSASGEPTIAGKAQDEVLKKVRSFAQQVESLNGVVASMENQLASLYSDKERLEREVGASEVDDVISAFRRLETVIMSMEHQLMNLYAGKELLEVELGKSDPRAIVAMFKTMSQLVDGLRTELGSEDELGAATALAA
jgi:chromosome segregation ATPase